MENITAALLQVPHLIGVLVADIVEFQFKSVSCKLTTLNFYVPVIIGVTFFIGKSCNGQGAGIVCFTNVTNDFRRCILGKGLTVCILSIMHDSVVCVLGVLGIVEVQDVLAVGGNNQTLLVGIGHVAGNGLKGLGDHGLAVVGNHLVIGKGLAGVLLHVLYGVRHSGHGHILEGDGQSLLVNIQHQGLGLNGGEVAFLIVRIQFRAALSIEGLGGAGQTGTGQIVGHLDAVVILQHILNGVLLQGVGRPFAVEGQILTNLHGGVEGLLITILVVVPHDEGVVAVGLGLVHGTLFQMVLYVLLRNVITMGNREAGFSFRLFGLIDFGTALRQVELDGAVYRLPLGVEDDVGGRHGMLIQLILLTGALGVLIPTAEHYGAGLISTGHFRFIVLVGAQGCFVLNALVLNIVILIVKGQFVAVAGVVELGTAIGCTIGS